MSITSYLFKYVTKKKGGGVRQSLFSWRGKQPTTKQKYNILHYEASNIQYMHRVASMPVWWRGSNDLIDNCHIQCLNIQKYHVTYYCSNTYDYMAIGVNGYNITESITDNKEK